MRIRWPAAAFLLIEIFKYEKERSDYLVTSFPFTLHICTIRWPHPSRSDCSTNEQKMHSVLYIALIIACVTLASASDVLVFTDSDFESKVKQHDILLAEFYAPWCGHCKFLFSLSLSLIRSESFSSWLGKRLAPEYEKAATALLKNDPPVALAKVSRIGSFSMKNNLSDFEGRLYRWNENM